MRIFLMLLGVAIAAGALLFWLYLKELAAGWVTSSSARPSGDWTTGEAVVFFWLPFAVGAAVAALGWKRR
jgi:hypothetical protein